MRPELVVPSPLLNSIAFSNTMVEFKSNNGPQLNIESAEFEVVAASAD